MRITNQMLARTSQKTGIPLQKNTLLDIMNKSSSSPGSLFSPVDRNGSTNSYLQKVNSQNSKELKEAAEELSGYASKLHEEGADSLFAKAAASGNTSEVVSNIMGLANSYNKTLRYLNGSDSALNKFYMQELKGYVSDHTDALRKVGVTRSKDGSLKVLEDTLKTADLDSLKEAFGSASGLSEKVGYVSGRVSENAYSSASILGGYNSDGLDYWNSFTKNMYDFWG